MTPETLASELRRRRCRASSLKRLQRVLTDWRAKHLLQKLTSRGRGYGRGKFNYWKQPNVLDRALLIFDLFASNEPADAVLIDIWLFGYDVSRNVIQAAWRDTWTKLEQPIRVRPAGAKRDDLMSSYAGKVARNIKQMTGMHGGDLELAIFEGCMLLTDERYQLDEISERTIWDAIRGIIIGKNLFGGRFNDQLAASRPPSLRQLAEKLRSSQSIGGMKSLISSASFVEIHNARETWVDLWSVISRFFGKRNRKMLRTNLTWDQHWRIVGGRHAVPAILSLVRQGHRTRIERTLMAIEDAFTKFYLARDLRELLMTGRLSPELTQLIGELIGIWESAAPVATPISPRVQ